jgi:hypothetical protein
MKHNEGPYLNNTSLTEKTGGILYLYEEEGEVG